jgi:hypothetical protein
MLHSLHGVNPLGLVYLTNMGRHGAESSVRHVYHEWFGDAPPPGYLAGGPNRDYTGNLAWIREQPPAKAFAEAGEDRGVHGYELTEPAIYYQACYVRLLVPFVTPRSADEP